MKLRTKFAIVLLAITILLSGATYGGLELYKQQQIADTQQSVNETAELTADQIDKTIDRYKDDLGAYAARYKSASDVTESDASSYLSNTDFWAMQVIAANGTVLKVVGSDLTEEYIRRKTGSDRSGDPIIQAVIKQGGGQMGETGEVPDGYAADLATPMFSETGRLTGFIVAAIDLDATTVFQMLFPLETSTQSVRVDDANTTLYPDDRQFDQRITSQHTIQSQGWSVVVTRDASGLTTDLRNLAIAQGVGLAVILMLVVAFGYWQYVTNLRQTERLLEGFKKLGQGNFTYSVSLGAGEEWEQISDGFNDLSLGLKEREERLRERQQRLEVLYRVLRHNLRNEMSIVQNYADIISDMSSEETIRDAADTILDAGEDLIGLSEKARQIENALQDASTEPTTLDAADVVQNVSEEMREDYPDVDIRTDLPDTGWAKAIPSLRMAVENVCENACKHNDAEDPEVEVSMTAPATATEDEQPVAATDGGLESSAAIDSPEDVQIEVADNGPGIPEQDRNVLREGRETALEHGSGLGLWLVYWIIDKSGGTLDFDENEPRGSIVTIELDASEPPADDAEETADSEETQADSDEEDESTEASADDPDEPGDSSS